LVKVYRKDLEGFYEVSEERANELISQAGYQLDPVPLDFGGGDEEISTEPTEPTFTVAEGKSIGSALYSFLPEAVIDEFAKQWSKSGNADLAIAATRQTSPWKDNYGYLVRDDGSLIMSELNASSTIATYKQTLGEVGIADFQDFEDDFKTLITGEVSGEEFQRRVDVVYAGVKDQIPEVERLFREQYNINVGEATIFGALVNPKIQDKILAGDIATIQLQAEASSRGFTTTFARFQELRQAGLTQQQARGLYESAGDILSAASSVGRDLDVSTLEDAALGDTTATNRLRRLQAEIQSQGGATLGAASSTLGEITGLIEN
jgi:hypothetical protein